MVVAPKAWSNTAACSNCFLLPPMARGKLRCASGPAPPASRQGRASSAPHYPVLGTMSKLSRDVETPVNMLPKSKPRVEEAQNSWEVQPLGQLAPASKSGLAVSGLTGRKGPNCGGGPPPSAGRQGMALALHQELGKGRSGKPRRFSVLSVPEISSCAVLNTNFVYPRNSEDK